MLTKKNIEDLLLLVSQEKMRNEESNKTLESIIKKRTTLTNLERALYLQHKEAK